jgi:Tfp pilus assembly major pilin PilA
MKTLSRSFKKQAGFTMLGWLIVAMIAGFFAYLAMLLFPVVISNHTMGTVLTSLQAEPGITQKSKREILSLINKRLRINDIKDVKTADFEIIREDANRISIYLDYENRIEFAKNIYIVIVNNKEVELTKN